MKSLISFLGKLGRNTFYGLRIVNPWNMTNNWMGMKATDENHLANRNMHKLNLNGLHARNGSRGEGMGMGHQIKHNKTK